MDDKWITIRAEIRCDESEDGEDAWDEKEFTIKYWVDRKILCISLLSVWFYERKDVERKNTAGETYTSSEPADIEKGAYLITRLLGLTACKKIH